MSYTLYPRLSTARASELRLGILSTSSAPVFDGSLLEDELLAAEAFPASGGVRVTAVELRELRERCVGALDEAAGRANFDVNIGRVFYQASEGSVGEFGDPRVWDFLTLVLLPDVAVRRFAQTGKDAAARLTGGNRRHVFQRLWKRWNVFGRSLVEAEYLTEDDYQAILERRLSSEMKDVAARSVKAILASGFSGQERREFARAFMRQLVQTSGLVDIAESDHSHLEALFDHVTSTTHRIVVGA